MSRKINYKFIDLHEYVTQKIKIQNVDKIKEELKTIKL